MEGVEKKQTKFFWSLKRQRNFIECIFLRNQEWVEAKLKLLDILKMGVLGLLNADFSMKG